jgi:long-chain acyl-CoA synthetase
VTTHDFSTGNLGDVILIPARPESRFLDLRGTPKFYSLAEMNDLASRLAGGFARLFRRGDRVAIIAENSVPFTLSYLGLMRAGMVAVPLNYRLPRETIDYMLADCRARSAIVDSANISLAPANIPAVSLDASLAARGVSGRGCGVADGSDRRRKPARAAMSGCHAEIATSQR